MNAINLLILVNPSLLYFTCPYKKNRVKTAERGKCRSVWILLPKLLLALCFCYCQAAISILCPTDYGPNRALHRVSDLIPEVAA